MLVHKRRGHLEQGLVVRGLRESLNEGLHVVGTLGDYHFTSFTKAFEVAYKNIYHKKGQYKQIKM